MTNDETASPAVLFPQKTPHISATYVRNWLMCPRAHAFDRIERVAPAFEPAARAFGSTLHAALAWVNEYRRVGGYPAPEAASDHFRYLWGQPRTLPLRYLAGASQATYAERGAALLALYVRRHEEPAVHETEPSFRVPLTPSLDLTGRFDLVRPFDTLVEYKTSSRAPNGAGAHKLQLAAYALAYRKLHGVRPRVELVTFVTGPAPEIVEQAVTITDRDEQFFVATAGDVHRAITERIFPPNPGWMCGSCPFQVPCRAWGASPAENDNAAAHAVPT